MKRRDFMGAICGAALMSPSVAHAQQPGKVWRIGHVLVNPPERGGAIRVQELEKGLADLGDVQGRNIELLHRFAGPQPEKLQEVISSLLPQINLLVVWGTVGAVAAKKVASGMPTVFVSVGAPVEIGLVQSLAHPGGNMTGITFEEIADSQRNRTRS